MKFKCANKDCDKVIDTTRKSYYAKQEVNGSEIEEINFCQRSCLNKYETVKHTHAS